MFDFTPSISLFLDFKGEGVHEKIVRELGVDGVGGIWFQSGVCMGVGSAWGVVAVELSVACCFEFMGVGCKGSPSSWPMVYLRRNQYVSPSRTVS